jgi:hypothetical protein
MSDDEREEVEDQKEEKEEKESASKGPKKKFEVKKWNAVALWAWGTYFYYNVRFIERTILTCFHFITKMKKILIRSRYCDR